MPEPISIISRVESSPSERLMDGVMYHMHRLRTSIKHHGRKECCTRALLEARAARDKLNIVIRELREEQRGMK